MEVKELARDCNSPVRGDVCAVLLVGGLGTRLRTVLSSTPKPLAPVGSKSFLHILIRQLRSQGIERVIMCTGYLADQIENEVGNGENCGVVISYSRELSPLGTGGALKLALNCMPPVSDCVVMNGDSFLDLDLRQLIEAHRERGALVSVAVRKVDNAARYGTVKVGRDNQVIEFLEKTGSQVPGLVNGGVYVIRRDVLQHIPEGSVSLETDIFPKMVGHGMFAFEQGGMFIDIGTPEDYARAQQVSDLLYKATS